MATSGTKTFKLSIADTIEEAENMAIYDETCQYFGVYSIETAELEEAEDE